MKINEVSTNNGETLNQMMMERKYFISIMCILITKFPKLCEKYDLD